MKKKVYCFLIAAMLVMSGASGCSNQNDASAPEESTDVAEHSLEPEELETLETSQDPLAFPRKDYTEQTIIVNTEDGEKQVAYRLYEHICYVAAPVEQDYQSMDVKIPIAVDDKAVDASEAPILLSNKVGGYLSSPNSNDPNQHNTVTEDRLARENTEKGGLQRNSKLALAAGYVVVEPGCRGRDNVTADGMYYGKAPAAIVDLKAAVRYLRYNDQEMPGDAEKIISAGVSAGGAMSALLGASGDSDLYDTYLEELGAADTSDKIFAAAAYCPITDLEHADMEYEWMLGEQTYNGQAVNQKISEELAEQFGDYQESLGLEGQGDFGKLTEDNYEEYLMEYYLEPSSTMYLERLEEEDRDKYLKEHPWITWKDGKAAFTFRDYVNYIGRSKDVPAFDDFGLTSQETQLFGDEQNNARHFTEYGIRNNTAEETNATIDARLQDVINMMNPMFFITQDNSGCSQYWWIRYGSSDTNTTLPAIVNLATALENKEKNVNTLLYWDAGHEANEDPDDFIAWIGKITGFGQSTAE